MFYIRGWGLLLLLFAYNTVATECAHSTTALESMQQQEITLINDRGDELLLSSLIADSDLERAGGFQHVCPYVIERSLILFVYNAEIGGRFHMRNVHAPLDIAFFDGAGKLIHTESMQVYNALSEPLYGSDRPFQFALEAKQGFFNTHYISTTGSYLKYALQ